MTHRGVIARDIEQDFGGAAAVHVSVAVPHTRYEVRLTWDTKETRNTDYKLELHSVRKNKYRRSMIQTVYEN